MHALEKQLTEQASILPITPISPANANLQNGPRNPKMHLPPIKLAAAMASAFFALCIVLQLALNFFYPVSPAAVPANGTAAAAGDGTFLLGVGKADITGCVNR